MPPRPEVLIEKWLPVDVIGAESMRERGASSALPPLYFLHVWWARRPLLTSRAAILASILPAWRADWPDSLRSRFPNEETYRAWFLRACGILGDPVAGRKLIQWAKDRKIKLKVPPYSHPRAFTVNPSPEVIETLQDLLQHTWGQRTLSVLDSFAGGGSIPFEALRYGFDTHANELNPVACVILKATLEYPARFGPSLADDIRKYGKLIADKVKERLEPFFPVDKGESIHAYIWARTVRCPYTGKPIPLSPNWWLTQSDEPVAVQPIFRSGRDEAEFEMVRGKRACERARPDEGTIRRGNAVSPWAHDQPVEGSYIKAEAQAGRMRQQLYALAIKTSDGLAYRPPGSADLAGVREAEAALAARLPAWQASELVPVEPRREGRADWAAEIYGMTSWVKTFAPRQLLALITIAEALKSTARQIHDEVGAERGRAVTTYLTLALDKAADYNAILSTWESSRQIVKHVFKRHDFGFTWSFGEFDAAHNLFPWVAEQVTDAYSGIAKLAAGAPELFRAESSQPVKVTQGSAGALSFLPDASIRLICVDPPYYDNVMYAECSNFFYVWMKRSLGTLYPGWFDGELTNSDEEAVANAARFREFGKKSRGLALADYERKMAGSFREAHRVLSDDGVLTVMFTHKKVEAWDTLATSLIGAGFAIHSSWPVHTESEHSLHQAKKNAAQSTILLTCRKRLTSGEPVWWDDLKGEVRRVAREKAQEFEKQGIRGVDLYIATFGPTLAILSERWPVLTSVVNERTGEPQPLRPEVALDLAREEVVALRKQGLLLGRTVEFDLFTDWYLMAWDAFQAEEFPADEARKLALALGLDAERQIVGEKRLVAKKSSTVVLQQPKGRRKKGMVDPDRKSFDCWIDAVHTAMLVYEEDGARACEAFLKEAGLRHDATFKACLQAALNAVPRTKQKGKFVRPEADVLEAIRLAFFDDLTPPKEPEEPKVEPEQLGLKAEGFDLDDEDEDEDDE